MNSIRLRILIFAIYLGLLTSCGSSTPPGPTSTPGPTPTPMKVIQEGWENIPVHTICLDIEQNFIDIPNKEPEDMEAFLNERLGEFGVVILPDGSQCDARLAISINLEAIGREYVRGGSSSGDICYTGSKVEGEMTLLRDDLPTISANFDVFDAPPTKIIGCNELPENTNFGSSWKHGLLLGITRLWGKEFMLNALDGDDSELKIIAIKELQQITQPEELIPALLDALKDDNTSVRIQAANAIKNYSSEAKIAVNALAECLDDEVYSVRYSCLEALRVMGEDAIDAVPALIASLSDSELRNTTITALESITGENYGKDKEAWEEWWEKETEK